MHEHRSSAPFHLRALVVVALAICPTSVPSLWAGEPDRELLKFCKTEESLPYSLFETYASFVAAMATGDPEKVRPFCAADAVVITTKARPDDRKDQGTDINMPFARNGFSKFITAVIRESDTRYEIRTATSLMWFEGIGDQPWRLVRYEDKRLE